MDRRTPADSARNVSPAGGARQWPAYSRASPILIMVVTEPAFRAAVLLGNARY